MKSFKLENIKSFKSSGNIELKPITIFVGKNSCGKSSLLRFPVLIAQTFKEDVIAPLLLFGNMIDYGNYDDIVNNHKEEPIVFEMDYGVIELNRYIHRSVLGRRRVAIDKLIKNYKKISLRTKVNKVNKRLIVQETELILDEHKLCYIKQTSSGKYDIVINGIPSLGEECNLREVNLSFQQFIPIIEHREIIGEYIKKFEESQQIKKIFEKISRAYDMLEDEPRNELEREIYNVYNLLWFIRVLYLGLARKIMTESEELTYIGPFRENPKRNYRYSESAYKDVGVRGENVSMILRQDVQENGHLVKQVSSWFEEAMGFKVVLEDLGSSLFSIMIENADGCKDNIIDTGYGISQVIPIVTQLCNNYNAMDRRQMMYYGIRAKRMYILEQPELHLHPAAQAQLADLFVESIIQNKERKILVETHSEHLIRKLQVLIADKNIDFSNDQVAIYYVDKDENGDSFVTRMNITENGQFKEEWPSGFFDKSYELTKLLLRANRRG